MVEDPRSAALALLQERRASVDEIWLRYWANGGNTGPVEFEAYLYGLLEPAEFDPVVLSWAVQEVLLR